MQTALHTWQFQSCGARRAHRREMSRQPSTFQLFVEDMRPLPATFDALSESFWDPGHSWIPEWLQDPGLTGILFSPGSWILWDLAYSWIVSDSGMPVILGCQLPHCTASLFHSGSGEWEMTPCYGGTEAYPSRVKKEGKKRREKKTSICGCDIVQTFIFSHTSIHSVILEGPAVLSWLQSMSHLKKKKVRLSGSNSKVFF